MDDLHEDAAVSSEDGITGDPQVGHHHGGQLESPAPRGSRC